MKKYFYQISADEAVKRLNTNAVKGLTDAEAKLRLEKYGPNKLATTKKRPAIFRFFDQFKDLLIIVLIIAAFLAYYLGDFRSGTILLIIVFVNACIGFYQEFKAEKILESLKNIIKGRALVIREGRRKEIDEWELVPGDIVYLEEGSAVPADVRLLETTHFSTNDFILTGESVPQEKKAELVIEGETTISDQDNLVFLGTTVAKGNALAVVYGTGMETAIGRIAKTSATIEYDLSPLQREINSLAKSLTVIAGIIALSLFVINLLISVKQGENLQLAINFSILFAISVAAASVPQGLPAQISVALSLGVGRLAKKNAIVKKLSSVETLGSTTVICSDKTGTITKNEMTITHCYMNGREFKVEGIGYDPTGRVTENGKPIKGDEFESIKQFFEDGYLASNGRTRPPDDNHASWYAIGDPTEAAFTPLAIKAGLDPDTLDKLFPMVQELPFDSDRKRMTIVRKHNGKHIAFMKGGLESVLSVCSKINNKGNLEDLTDKEREALIATGEKFAGKALRVIALAYRDFGDHKKEFAIEEDESDFIFAGFVAMIDPPRGGVSEALKSTYGAHIRVMMITGDNAVTAKAIAERIGMQTNSKELLVYTGDDIKEKTDQELKDILKARSVIFSRVSPEDKFRLVTLLKTMGDVVAVTGDGVNDTLSLKKSDIGVSMGKLGSEVAKEASDIVLMDDNFSTLTVAIREGRTIFYNLKNTILASITSNNGELACVLLGFIGMAFGLPAPITAVQILAVDLIGEMLPLTAMTFDPAEESTMTEPPRDLDDHILNRPRYLDLIFYGFWMGASGFFSFVMIYLFGTGTLGAAQAGAYSGIILSQYINILSRRTNNTIFTKYLFANKQLWGSFIISIVAVLLMINYEPLGIWFGFEQMSLLDWTFPVIGAVVFLFWHEAKKFAGIRT